ncbi:TIGR04222 domain-containing membrane protein [Streptomyces sp. WAC06614]|uniref:TIGR04222 domain-containing membrane protein n=1 Tax=Streptomyces sp. WAC06614 TaxID=2487416 RepID=UPI000F78CD27|nr:TIGR04222 domain-containing membrane protein [Streptomyces sp. WAC06614]RSS80602.1 TIGR04222 domain-containing membrane protein [Streptomyces sp. WAC06614]
MTFVAVLVWVAVVGSSVALARALRRWRPGASVVAPRLHELSEAAFLAGGPGRVVDSALVALHGNGRMVVGGPGIIHFRPGARAVDPAEQAVVHACLAAPSGSLHLVRHGAMRHPAVQEIGDALAARGLLAPAGSGRAPRRWAAVQAVLCTLGIPVAFVATIVQYAVGDGAPVPFVVLVLPVLVLGIVLGVRYAGRARGRATPAGRRALDQFRAAHRGDRTPHVRVALQGPRATPDPVLRAQLLAAGRYRPGPSAGSRSGSDAGSGGDDGAADAVPVVWCAGVDGGGSSGCGDGSGGSCGSGGGSGCSSGPSGSSCGGSVSSCSSASSCGSSSSSSCGSSSSSSCSSSSS